VKKLAVYTLAVCSLISTSCATLLKGTNEEITVVSDPSGAKVSTNESERGTTPVSFTVPSKEDLNISVTKAGYKEQDLQDPTSFRWGYEVWSFIEWVIPMVVDLSDGAAWGHDHLTMTAHLEPNAQSAAASDGAAPAPSASSATPPPAASAASAVKASIAASDVKPSPLASPSPAVQIVPIAVAPIPPPAAAPSTSTATQPAILVTPPSPITSTPQ
jgi:hypothetical protein